MFTPSTTATSKPATTFTLTGAVGPTTTQSASSGFTFGGAGDKNATTSKPAAPLFGAQSVPSVSFSSTTTPLSFGVGTATATVAPATTTSTGLQFSFGGAEIKTASSFTPILSSATTLPTAASLPNFQASVSTAPSTLTTSSEIPKLSFGQTLATSASTTTTLAVATTQPSTTAAPTETITFAQLEDMIGKWTVDLEEQGKHYVNQAKQINMWDNMLISNGDKILLLNQSIERVKQEQQQLDQELDFVLAQQKELEELIEPLKKELEMMPQSVDQERNNTYQLAENIDSELKQMSEDLKAVIEHLNESNKDEDFNDPMTQISRILNAHMNSLQWIDRNTTQISAHLEQIQKLQDMSRRSSVFES